MASFSPHACHNPLLDQAPCRLAFSAERDFLPWRAALGEKLRELVGVMPDAVPLDLRVEALREDAGVRETRFVFTAEAGAEVPAYLLTPAGDGPFPVVICLQGHTSGMHISLGRALYDGDAAGIAGGRDFGVQAVREGYAALVLEQRCFGERRDDRPQAQRGFGAPTCLHASMAALLLGRTMVGERVWDISRAIDALAAFPQLDLRRIACMGNSGGGTISYYAACLDPRISAVMPSCAVCTYRDSIGRIDHCADNYLPGVLNWAEMGDFAALIAPRPLLIVAGREDPIFPLRAVEENFAHIHAIY
ncbi:MAG TPA: acetylxylan esterase, partial [Armatimonadota bacterium]